METQKKIGGFILVLLAAGLLFPGLLSPHCGQTGFPLCDDWTIWIRDYQSLIAGLLAGGGALWTLRGMRELDAKAAMRHAETERLISRHQRQNVMLAIWPTAQKVQSAVIPNLLGLKMALLRLERLSEARGLLMGRPGHVITLSTLSYSIPPMRRVIQIVNSAEYKSVEHLMDRHTSSFSHQLKEDCLSAENVVSQVGAYDQKTYFTKEDAELAYDGLPDEIKVLIPHIDAAIVNLTSSIKEVILGMEILVSQYEPYYDLSIIKE